MTSQRAQPSHYRDHCRDRGDHEPDDLHALRLGRLAASFEQRARLQPIDERRQLRTLAIAARDLAAEFAASASNELRSSPASSAVVSSCVRGAVARASRPHFFSGAMR